MQEIHGLSVADSNPQGIYPDVGNDRIQCHFRRSGGLCPPEEN